MNSMTRSGISVPLSPESDGERISSGSIARLAPAISLVVTHLAEHSD